MVPVTHRISKRRDHDEEYPRLLEVRGAPAHPLQEASA
jgi:hypothetical protein